MRTSTLALSALALVPALAAVLLPLLPLGLERRVEAAAGRAGLALAVGKARIALLPSPRLVLREVRTPDFPEGRLGRADLVPSLSSLAGGDRLHFRVVALEDLQAGSGLIERLGWLGGAGTRGWPGVQADRLTLHRGTWVGKGFRLEGIGADLRRGPDGPGRAVLTLREGRLRADLDPERGGFRVLLRGEDLALPSAIPVRVDGVDAQGRLTGDGLQLRTVELRLAGGVVRGDLTLSWRGGWRVASRFSVDAVDPGLLVGWNPADSPLSGRLALRGALGARAASPAKLVAALRGEAAFTLERGVLRGFDLAALVRAKAPGPNPGDTAFDRLSGLAEYRPGFVRLRELELNSTALTVRGEASAGQGGAISGRLVVVRRGAAVSSGVPFDLGGTMRAPVLGPGSH